MDISKEEVLTSLRTELQKEKDRRLMYALTAQVLEKYSGKRITKAIEQKLVDKFPENFKIHFYREEPYEQKLWIRKMYGSKEVWGERITLTHESFGKEFSMVRYLDGENRTPYIISRIHELEDTIVRLDEIYPLFEEAITLFERGANNFKLIMQKTRILYGHVDRGTQEFIEKHT